MGSIGNFIFGLLTCILLVAITWFSIRNRRLFVKTVNEIIDNTITKKLDVMNAPNSMRGHPGNMKNGKAESIGDDGSFEANGNNSKDHSMPDFDNSKDDMGDSGNTNNDGSKININSGGSGITPEGNGIESEGSAKEKSNDPKKNLANYDKNGNFKGGDSEKAFGKAKINYGKEAKEGIKTKVASGKQKIKDVDISTKDGVKQVGRNIKNASVNMMVNAKSAFRGGFDKAFGTDIKSKAFINKMNEKGITDRNSFSNYIKNGNPVSSFEKMMGVSKFGMDSKVASGGVFRGNVTSTTKQMNELYQIQRQNETGHGTIQTRSKEEVLKKAIRTQGINVNNLRNSKMTGASFKQLSKEFKGFGKK